MEDTLARCHLQELLPLPLDQITPYVLDQLMARMHAAGRSPQTIRHVISLVRRIMRRMAAWDLYDGPMPFRQVTLPRPDNARQRYLTPEEARLLLAEQDLDLLDGSLLRDDQQVVVGLQERVGGGDADLAVAPKPRDDEVLIG